MTTQMQFSGMTAAGRTYAGWKVWKGSAREEVPTLPFSKKQAVRLFHEARRFERHTRRRGKQDGALGRNGIAVLHALLFDFLNYASGRMDPCYESIAQRANISVRSVARGLAKLKKSGVLGWVRRCVPSITQEGRYCLRQISNTYIVKAIASWVGHFTPPPAPPPDRDSWGGEPLSATGLSAAADAARDGGGGAAVQAALEADPGDGLSAALARLGRGREG